MRHSSCGGSANSASSVRNASDRARPLPRRVPRALRLPLHFLRRNPCDCDTQPFPRASKPPCPRLRGILCEGVAPLRWSTLGGSQLEKVAQWRATQAPALAPYPCATAKRHATNHHPQNWTRGGLEPRNPTARTPLRGGGLASQRRGVATLRARARDRKPWGPTLPRGHRCGKEASLRRAGGRDTPRLRSPSRTQGPPRTRGAFSGHFSRTLPGPATSGPCTAWGDRLALHRDGP